jgi:T-complex protein 1 subunit eta
LDGARAQSCTLLLRGGAEQFIAETERSLHDAIMIVRRAMKNDSIVAGISIYIIYILDFSKKK